MELSKEQIRKYKEQIYKLKEEKRKWRLDDYEQRGQIQGEIDEIRDLLDGKPSLHELSDSELKKRRDEFFRLSSGTRWDRFLDNAYIGSNVEKQRAYEYRYKKCDEETERRKKEREAAAASASSVADPDFMEELARRLFEKDPGCHFALFFYSYGVFAQKLCEEGIGNADPDHGGEKIFICEYPFKAESGVQLYHLAEQLDRYLSNSFLNVAGIRPADEKEARTASFACLEIYNNVPRF